ncbi:bifunctional phosphopantothenoylcysteine decarboxylase/phosphopantothenate--cysteine ligase CoaBC [Olsenella sp. Marseille-P4559]|uniref:bifunctional phosphopantothenoylcysteine decarboxylase/phosphopantothenate--cysteine ligase CoaBC n=1 Tax=Olsenella sp. Marseille-P4559 TaxID=2364795 RepID=UPI0010306AE2|nr:bifunctional phosphopantothenoylcysteine decarboxylase/phosphopantothenate--cysteine ligase CoaBC [Olsenella sp. Marseille-P4559]
MIETTTGTTAPHVVLAVTGGIAAYKAVEVMRLLQHAGCDVRVTMTADAERFVGTPTFEALSGHPIADDLYSYPDSAIPHIFLADWADLVLVVPATANVLAKMAAGIGDDCLTTTLIATHCPVLVAAAMNVHMWRNPATQANIEKLLSRGVRFVKPQSGLLACGDIGEGKLAEVEEIAAAALDALNPAQRDMAGMRLVITAGPTHEAIDPVRYIANASTGKMGYAIAREAARRGAAVTLVSGPVGLEAPRDVDVVPVVSAAEMHDAALGAFANADAAICAAAVADYTPAAFATRKLKKGADDLGTLNLVQTADILADLSRTKGGRVVVGFAAETDDLLENAHSKLARKGCDLIVANDVSRPDSTFGADTSRIAFVWPDRTEQLDTLPLDRVAAAICDQVALLVTGGRA